MYKRIFTGLLLVASFGFSTAKADNPIIQTAFTADPAPMVHNGTVYLYTSHDEDSTVQNFFTMYDWRCYSSTDMVNWTDHGAVASLKSFKWLDKTNGAWAVQCVERNGKFYLYVPIHGEGISVLVADSPIGPFVDPLGKRLVDSDHLWQDIDPTVFVDTNGQAYLYWGNPGLWYVKLNDDMISYDKTVGKNGVVSIDMTADAFGSKPGRDGKPGTTYTEGPWFYKRNHLYYMLYAAAGVPEYIAYSTATSPEGPWKYAGLIMERAPQLAFTNHVGTVDFKGNSYLFYHDQSLSVTEGFKRSVCVEQFSYNADGTIPLIKPTPEGVTKSVANLNPYQLVQAETMAFSKGVKTKKDDKDRIYVTHINNDDYIKVRSVDFVKGAKSFRAGVAAAKPGAVLEIRLDDKNGQLMGTLPINPTSGDLIWSTQKCTVASAKGVHDLYFVFKGTGDDLFSFDWWQFF